MSKKRAGVAASIRLASTTNDVKVWEKIALQYESIRSDKLVEAEGACRKSRVGDDDTAAAKFTELSKEQLLTLVQWKFSVGKPRPQNLGLLQANSDAKVRSCTRLAIQRAHNLTSHECVDDSDDGELMTADSNRSIQEALEALTELRGVGPATATAVLCRIRPDVMCYMYDEVIDCFEPKREYNMKVYLRINLQCARLATELGKEWTAARVAKVLWTAARVLAAGGDDLTSTIQDQKTSKGRIADLPKPKKRRINR